MLRTKAIVTLIHFGGQRYTKGGIDRVYFEAEILGEEAKESKNFINIKTGEAYSTVKGEGKEQLEDQMRQILQKAEETESSETSKEQVCTAEPAHCIAACYFERGNQNLVKMAKRYAGLLKKATGFIRLEILEGVAKFYGMDAENEAHQMLVRYIRYYAEGQRRIRDQEELRPDNEKFAFRMWLMRMGWKGRETSKLRTSLYKGLIGNSAFCTEASRERWKEKWQGVTEDMEA